MKRKISLLLAFVMIFSLLPMTVAGNTLLPANAFTGANVQSTVGPTVRHMENGQLVARPEAINQFRAALANQRASVSPGINDGAGLDSYFADYRYVNAPTGNLRHMLASSNIFQHQADSVTSATVLLTMNNAHWLSHYVANWNPVEGTPAPAVLGQFATADQNAFNAALAANRVATWAHLASGTGNLLVGDAAAITAMENLVNGTATLDGVEELIDALQAFFDASVEALEFVEDNDCDNDAIDPDDLWDIVSAALLALEELESMTVAWPAGTLTFADAQLAPVVPNTGDIDTQAILTAANAVNAARPLFTAAVSSFLTELNTFNTALAAAIPFADNAAKDLFLANNLAEVILAGAQMTAATNHANTIINAVANLPTVAGDAPAMFAWIETLPAQNGRNLAHLVVIRNSALTGDFTWRTPLQVQLPIEYITRGGANDNPVSINLNPIDAIHNVHPLLTLSGVVDSRLNITRPGDIRNFHGYGTAVVYSAIRIQEIAHGAFASLNQADEYNRLRVELEIVTPGFYWNESPANAAVVRYQPGSRLWTPRIPQVDQHRQGTPYLDPAFSQNSSARENNNVMTMVVDVNNQDRTQTAWFELRNLEVLAGSRARAGDVEVEVRVYHVTQQTLEQAGTQGSWSWNVLRYNAAANFGRVVPHEVLNDLHPFFPEIDRLLPQPPANPHVAQERTRDNWLSPTVVHANYAGTAAQWSNLLDGAFWRVVWHWTPSQQATGNWWGRGRAIDDGEE